VPYFGDDDTTGVDVSAYDSVPDDRGNVDEGDEAAAKRRRTLRETGLSEIEEWVVHALYGTYRPPRGATPLPSEPARNPNRLRDTVRLERSRTNSEGRPLRSSRTRGARTNGPRIVGHESDLTAERDF
jgi:hypothetical protein